MPWVKFSEPFNWLVPERNGAASIHYKAGHSYLVRTLCAEEAIAKGKAVAIPSPRQTATATTLGGDLDKRAKEYERALAKAQTATFKKIKRREADVQSTD